jgi:hypothetical protein
MKNLIYSVLLTIGLLWNLGCENFYGTEPPEVTSIPSLEFYIVDSMGNDLLDSQNPNSYNIKEFELYLITETGSKRLYYRGSMLVHRGLNAEILSFNPVYTVVDTSLQVMYLKLDSLDIDTIGFKLRLEPYLKTLDVVYYNNQLVYENNQQTIDTLIKK